VPLEVIGEAIKRVPAKKFISIYEKALGPERLARIKGKRTVTNKSRLERERAVARPCDAGTIQVMADPKVAQWRQRGAVYCWRYCDNRKNYPGWNLTADSQACESLVQLLDLMLAGKYSSQAAIPISPPTEKALQAVNGPERWMSASEMTLHYPKSKVEPGHWSLKSNEGRIAITLGEARLNELRSGVVDVSQGRGDWAAPNDDDEIDDAQLLYFWPLKWARGSRAYGR
jgi:hypothetical protein